MARIVSTAPNTILGVKIYEIVVKNDPGEENFSINDGLKNGLEEAQIFMKQHFPNQRYLGMVMLNEKLTVYFFSLD